MVRTLLQYLYTGQCLFPREDLNLGLDLMFAADQFLLEPMRLQCERALSDKIDSEVGRKSRGVDSVLIRTTPIWLY